MHTKEEKLEAFARLLDIQERLRKECPWDSKQTNESLRPNTIEETFELADALLKNDSKNICKELGDVMEHVIFYSMLGEEKGDFDVAEEEQAAKNAQSTTPNTASQVESTWEQRKQRERDGNTSVLSGVPNSLPSLIKAYRIQDKARNVGFDWEEKEQVWDKVYEELEELKNELMKEDKQRSTEELGDFLFSLINAARLYHLNPDNALEHTNQKFIKRFNYIEEAAKAKGVTIKDLTLAEMDELWNQAKAANN